MLHIRQHLLARAHQAAKKSEYQEMKAKLDDAHRRVTEHAAHLKTTRRERELISKKISSSELEVRVPSS